MAPIDDRGHVYARSRLDTLLRACVCEIFTSRQPLSRRAAGFLPQLRRAATATHLAFIRSHHTLQNALALSSYGPTSNAQHDQRYKSDADEQHYERDGVVFEPMPITGKHNVSSLFQMDCENRSAVAPRSSGGLLS